LRPPRIHNLVFLNLLYVVNTMVAVVFQDKHRSMAGD
jgi:hypothetical protein